jgi:hypothetical protein
VPISQTWSMHSQCIAGLCECVVSWRLIEHREMSCRKQDQVRPGGKLLEQVQDVMVGMGTDSANGDLNSLTDDQDLKKQLLELHLEP